MTFAPLGLIDPLQRTLEELGYSTPTAIQEQAIPAILKGRDLLASAQTGTLRPAVTANTDPARICSRQQFSARTGTDTHPRTG